MRRLGLTGIRSGCKAHRRLLACLHGCALFLKRAQHGIVYRVENCALVGEFDLCLGRMDVYIDRRWVYVQIYYTGRVFAGE